MKNLLLIVNPVAGRRRILRRLDRVMRVFEEAELHVTLRFTQGAGDATRIAAGEAPSCDLVVCAGGDGTLSETAAGLLRLSSPPPLGYIPAGTTNDFAAGLGLSRRPVRAARDIVRAVLSDRSCPIDVARLGSRPFLYVASCGLFSRSSYSTAQKLKNLLGHFAYVLEGFKEIPHIRPVRLRVTAEDGSTREGSYIMGALANSLSIGGTVRLSPRDVAFDDGAFEVLLIENPARAGDLRRIFRALRRRRYENSPVALFHASRLRIECLDDDPLPWSLDGEHCPAAPAYDFEVLPRALRMLLPPQD